MRNRLTLVVPLLLATCLAGIAGAEGFRLVAHPSVTVSAMSRADLVRLYLKKASTWPDGQKAVVIDQERASGVRRAFSRAVHGRDTEAVVSFWQTMVLSGRETPPPIRSGDAEVLALVRATPGAVGYVGKDAPLDGVKPIAVK